MEQRCGFGDTQRIATEITRVLIVDNHELMRRGLAAVINAEPDLKSCGEVAGTEAALAAVAAICPDVVLVDVSASSESGLLILQGVRRHHPDVRIVALAMSDKPDLVERIYDAGAEAFVIKTSMAERVLEAVRRGRSQQANAGQARFTTEPSRSQARRAAGGLDAVEREIVRHIGRGIPNRDIALNLGMSLARVGMLRRRVRRKLNCPTATQFVEFCVRWTERKVLAG